MFNFNIGKNSSIVSIVIVIIAAVVFIKMVSSLIPIVIAVVVIGAILMNTKTKDKYKEFKNQQMNENNEAMV